ncbi:cytochrome b/b6 domain-containing protein [Hymenobacter guriensis]|uniref:Cytochrome b/b6 domain-containing protein n=1 Tax=Hymenobacter guriensis TaxID=2793065 RepID=A0ABS0L204_9BACT|nr:cytochrome b/b6 domain-containing protein [Hymenobacter guriensis]MBG8554137.1 cytochrome b/b6 domain-containing protein [Hymenobacter guriensis]
MSPMTETPSVKKYSAGLRIWHWSNYLVISGLLSTILFLRVIINMRGLFPKMQQVLQEQGITATEQQLRGVGRLVSHRIWDWHIYLGVALSILLGWRMVTELVQPAVQSFRARLRQANQAPAEGAGFRLRKSAAVKYSYLLFYLLLTVMVVTGLLLVYADDVEALHKLEHTIKEIHNVNMYLILAFIVVHIVGVVWAELHKDRGITSDMLHGGQAASQE